MISTLLDAGPRPASAPQQTPANPYERCIAASRRARWEIDSDVIRGRRFDLSHKFLPDGLSRVHELKFLSPAEARALSQIQGRTYANMFGLIERYVAAKVVSLAQDHAFNDQAALEALVRFGDEELKHQALFRRIEALAAEAMPEGYVFDWDPDAVARTVLAKPEWSVLALTLHVELFTQAHFQEALGPDDSLSPLFKDVFKYHWREESQHAQLDELEWRRIDADTTPVEREAGINGLIALVGAVDGIVTVQADVDAEYFLHVFAPELTGEQAEAVHLAVRRAYRWQYILSGAQHPHFLQVLSELATSAQIAKVVEALATIA